MKEYFKEQIENGNPIDDELLNEIQQKNYDSGEIKQIGDIILYGFNVQFNIVDDKENISLNLFSLCEREFDYYSERYTIDKNNSFGQFPILVKKGEEEKYESMKSEHLKNQK